MFTGEVKKVMGGVNLSLPLSILAMLLLLLEIAYRRLDFNININFLKKFINKKSTKNTPLVKKEVKIKEEVSKELPPEPKKKAIPKKEKSKEKDKKDALDTSSLLKKKQDRNNNKF
ncbi:hypothetical protein D3C73_1302330 [compost metagenome]